jgi:hypothetical protein
MTTPKRPFVYLLVAIATFASTFSIGYRISELMVRVPQITVTKTLVPPSFVRVNLTESTQGYDRSQEDHVSVTFLDSVKKRLFGGLFLAIALCCGYSGLFCLIFYDSRNIGDYWFRAIGLNRMGSNRIGKALRIGSGTGLLIAFVLIAWHGFTLLH